MLSTIGENTMAASSPSSDPPDGLGVISVVLGSLGTLLFFLPILGIPLGIVGLALGGVGLVLALIGGWTSLRWSAAGIVLSCVALGIGVIITQAANTSLEDLTAPSAVQHTPAHVSPPARP
jgi:hypothetical protein